MARKTYEHSAYWYAKNCGRTRSDKASHVERLIDEVRRDLKFGGGRVNGNVSCDPIGFGVCLAVCTAMDIGVAMRETVRSFADPAERDRMRRELLRDLRAVRRPFYYARETARRRELAAERRKVRRRTTLAPEPTPADVLAAWERRKDSKEDMIRLGGMLHDLECYVDNALRFNGASDVVGRNGGIRGWLKENLPELSPKYKTLMRYKAMAIRLRQATGTKDPTPTAALLKDKAPHEAVRELLEDFRMTFSSLEGGLAQRLDPERVFLDTAKSKGRRLGLAKTRPKERDKGHGGREKPRPASSRLARSSSSEAETAVAMNTGTTDPAAECTANYALIRPSDAHIIDDVARAWTEAVLPEFSVAALKDAFVLRATRLTAF